MKVTKDQMVNGIVSYIDSDVIPQIGDKATQIMASIAVKAVKANNKLVDAIFGNQTVKSLLNETDGMYEIDDIFRYIEESIQEFGPFPVIIPSIPLISPDEKTLSFNSEDIQQMKRKIERSM